MISHAAVNCVLPVCNFAPAIAARICYTTYYLPSILFLIAIIYLK